MVKCVLFIFRGLFFLSFFSFHLFVVYLFVVYLFCYVLFIYFIYLFVYLFVVNLLIIYVYYVSEKKTEVNISVPIHMRYQTPQLGATHVPVHIHPPEVYIQCDDQPGAQIDFPFVARRLPNTASGVALTYVDKPVLTVQVPNGKMEDVGLVGIGTALATFVATAFILVEIFWKKMNKTS
jgi:PIG-X / PBN1